MDRELDLEGLSLIVERFELVDDDAQLLVDLAAAPDLSGLVGQRQRALLLIADALGNRDGDGILATVYSNCSQLACHIEILSVGVYLDQMEE